MQIPCISILKDIPDNILKFVGEAYPWDTVEFTPSLTGVAPHFLLMSEIEIPREKIEDLQKRIKSEMNKILDERSVGGNEFPNNANLGAIEESNNKILSVINNVTTRNGNEDVLPKNK